MSSDERRKIEQQAQEDARTGNNTVYPDIASHRRGHYFNPTENEAYQNAFLQEARRERKRRK